MTTPPTPQRPGRIAILAVHGVGEQEPNESARAMARLLGGRNDRGVPRLEVLAEETIHIPVRPMWERRAESPAEIDKTPPPRRAKRVLGALLRPLSAIGGSRWRAEYARSKGEEGDDLGLLLMDEQLRYYEGAKPSDTYETTRIRTRRRGTGGDADVEIDIHELYWADLSQARTGFLRIAAEMYQLFFHLANLGALLADNLTRKSGRHWHRFANLQSFAAGMLTTIVPLLNVVMAATVLAIPLLSIPPGGMRWVVAAAIGIAGAAAADGLWARIKPSSSPWRLVVPLVVGLLLGGTALTMANTETHPSSVFYMLVGIWFPLAMYAVAWLVPRWDRHQPGLLEVAYAIGVLWIACIAFAVWTVPGTPEMGEGLPLAASIVLRAFDFLYATNAAVFFGYFALAAVVCVYGKWLERGLPRDDDRRRTVDTARATLILPTVGMLLMTLLGWIAMYAAFERFVPKNVPYNTVLPSDLHWTYVHEWLDHLLKASPGSGFVPFLALIGVALAIVLWSAVPVIWADVHPPHNASDGLADRMGKRLTMAYRASGPAAVVLAIAIGAYITGLVFDEMRRLGIPDTTWRVPFLEATHAVGFHPDLTNTITRYIAGALGLSAVGLFALRGRLDVLTLGLRPVLDIALDVDNYLRLHPADGTPRARIVERMSSMLHHLVGGGTPGQTARPKYDGVIIVAHSQGTVITADLLRYMSSRDLIAGNVGWEFQSDRDWRAGRWVPPLPVHLFTMGSPLRQLYRLRFPALYEWIGPSTASSRLELPDDALPLTDEMGVSTWYNVYRSGDYVGRNIWFDRESCKAVYRRVDDEERRELRQRTTDPGSGSADPIHFAKDGPDLRREACVGAGGHTHYWDDTAPDVAAILDDLVSRAVGQRETGYVQAAVGLSEGYDAALRPS